MLDPARLERLTETQRRTVLAFARAILPQGRVFAAGNERTVGRAEALLRDWAPGSLRRAGRIVQLLDWAAVGRAGRRFQKLDAGRQEEVLQSFERDPLLRWPLFLLSSLLKLTHFDDEAVYQAMGCVWGRGGTPEPARWMSQLRRAQDFGTSETLECDVVVVGTGAGGAVVAKELAARGLAVVMIEEGELHRRDEFRGRGSEAHAKFYRGKGRILGVGNTILPIFMGRLVGGSTAVNTGTCFRTPPWILDRWCEDLATDEFSAAALAPHFERVERELRVETARADYLGGVARVVARGCEQLGWKHFPVRRNAPDCDGQGVCDYGCPTDAKRSTNVSYVPAALGHGAVLVTGARAHRVLVEGGRAVGIEAAAPNGVSLQVRARAVVLSGGAVPTPALLLYQGICNASGEVGKNLSVHPATAVSALFDEKIAGYNAIPQGYGCDQFHEDGILLLGASAPLDVGALMFPFVGRRLMDAMESFDRVASFGVMIEDEGRGRVRVGRDGKPRIRYFLERADVDRLQRGMGYVARIFFAAGAKKVFPLLPRVPVLEDAGALDRFQQMRLRPWNFLLTSFHPLGTCRMGRDARTSVVGLDHETHEVRSLFVVDGSTVPGPPAVNPQITIMAMADRAAGKIAERLA